MGLPLGCPYHITRQSLSKVDFFIFIKLSFDQRKSCYRFPPQVSLQTSEVLHVSSANAKEMRRNEERLTPAGLYLPGFGHTESWSF